MPRKRKKSSRLGAYYVVPVDRLIIPSYDHRYSHQTLPAARKALAAAVKESLRECRRSYKRCSQNGTVKDGMVEIRIGPKTGYHLYERLAIRRR